MIFAESIFLAILTIVAVAAWRSYVRRSRVAKKLRHVRYRGREAIASVTETQRTGHTLNDAYEMRIWLWVMPEGAEPFQGQVVRYVDPVDLPKLQKGTQVEVRYDPEDTSFVWLRLPGHSPDGAGASLIVAVVATLFVIAGGFHFSQTIATESLAANGRSASATIISIEQTGSSFNDNPEVHFVLEVHPRGSPPFRANAVRVVHQLDIPRIQPGMTVSVRYGDVESGSVAVVLGDD